MKILAFDTSNNSCSVAVSEGQKILAYLEDLTPSMQAQMLMPMAQECLERARLSYDDIDYLAVTSGPGSFTGIRIGLAAATGIMLGTSIQCSSLSNFDVAYYKAKSQVKYYDNIVAVLDAYREQLYVQIFSNNGPTEPILLGYGEAVELVAKQNGVTVVAGSGTQLIYDNIKSLPRLIILPRFTRVKALHICRYMDDIVRMGGKFKPIEPLYVRPPDAKINNKLVE